MQWERDEQRTEILDHPARFKVICAGRRWGKTILALMWLMDGEIHPGERRWFIAPTYRQGKMIVLPLLRDIARKFNDVKLKESELTIAFNNNAEVSIKGADNEDSLRGAGLSRVVMDEYAYMKPHVWEEIVYPMLATTQAPALFIGTPDGYNQFYDVWSNADPEWKSWQFKTVDGGHVPREEIERAKSTMDARLFRQEFEATFETSGNRAAYNFDRDIHVTTKEDSGKKYWGIDFNVDYMTAVLMCEYTDSSVHVLDEIRLSNSNTMEISARMAKIAPNLRVYPDPAGKARSTSGRSDHAILREAGFTVIARNAHPSHRDRLNSLNRKLMDANDKIGLSIDPSCKYVIKDLEQVQRDKSGGLDKSNIELTHALDALSYAIEYRFPIRQIAKSVKW